MANKNTIVDAWNYYLTIEQDLIETSRYVDYNGQENVYSYEFAKIIVAASVEAESLFKTICKEISGKDTESITSYKRTILKRTPEIEDAKVYARRMRREIEPFKNWSSGKLRWWTAYTKIKHNRMENMKEATLLNAVTTVSAVYVLLFYLAELNDLDFACYESQYFVSDYGFRPVFYPPAEPFPGFSRKKYDEAYYTYSDLL